MKKIPLNPLGWLLVGVAGVLLLLVVGVYAASTFGSTRINGDARTELRQTFNWSGGTLILENVERNRQVTCTVTPASGEARDVQLVRQTPGSKLRRYDELGPWFTGSAGVTCTGDARAWSGSSASLYKFAHSALFRFGGPALVAVPLVIAFAFGRRRQPVANG